MSIARLAVAAAFALSPAVAGAATVIPSGTNQFFVNYGPLNADPDLNDEIVNLGNLNLALGPVAVSAHSNPVTPPDVGMGSLTFGVFADPFRPGAAGSIDINIIASGAEDWAGSFDGIPLVFQEVGGDFVATFSTTFDSASDVAIFDLAFENFRQGDTFQVNVAAIPLPAGIVLLGTALAGLGFARRFGKG